MILGDRSLYDLSLDDFRALVDKHEAEGPHLEYKESAYRGKGDEIREMLRDITALANAEGGYLVIGVQEDVARSRLRHRPRRVRRCLQGLTL
jgi:hypothetical protein